MSLQINHPKYNQRHVSCVKFLGELYNYVFYIKVVLLQINHPKYNQQHVSYVKFHYVFYIIIVFLQINHPKYNQRRVSCVKFLGELYNYRMVESAVIFKTLYSFITFGVSLDGMLNVIVIIYKTGMLCRTNLNK